MAGVSASSSRSEGRLECICSANAFGRESLPAVPQNVLGPSRPCQVGRHVRRTHDAVVYECPLTHAETRHLIFEVTLGIGRIAALQHLSSTAYQIRCQFRVALFI
jgi:hypothetical protein